MDLRDAAAYHLMVLGSEGKSVHTQRNYRFYERLLIEGFQELGIPLTLEAITTASARSVVDWYRGRASHGKRGGVVGVSQFARRLKAFVNFLENEEVLAQGTLSRFHAPRVAKVLREPFTQMEVNAMWGACQLSATPARDEALLLLLLDTGMRIGEAAALHTKKLRLDQRQVLVGEHGKGKRERLVPFGDGGRRDGGRSMRAMRTYLTVRRERAYSDDYVFLTRNGRPLTAEGASTAIQRLGAHAGVNNPIPYRLRHTFCTWYLVAYPGDELGLRRIVGHLSHDVLADYVHFAQSIIAERAGRASLSEAWLGTGHAPPGLVQRQTAAGALATNEQPRTAADPQPRKASGTHSIGKNDSRLSNVSGYRIHVDERIEPYAF